MRSELKALHAQVGATMVYVTHDQTEALTLGDRIAVMRAGLIVQVGTPDEIWREPASLFVARFVGNPGMNIPPGGNGRALGIRPEHVAVGGEGNAGRGHAGRARRQRGIRPPPGRRGRRVARVAAEGRPAAGETVRFRLPAEHTHRFDAETGERLRT